MLIDLNELNYKDEITLDLEVHKDENLDKRIIDLKNARIIGKIFNTETGAYMDLEFKGTMVISDSVTLEPIDYPFLINISEELEEIKLEFSNCFENTKNTLDIFQFLWENIVLEVPIRYTQTKDAEMSGNGWELRNGDKLDECDPRLEKLKELLKGDD